MDRSVLASKLRVRGFQVVEPLKCAGHAAIFRVKDSLESDWYVAKAVSLAGLDPKGRASAQQEVSLLKGLSAHPNLIAYRESFLEEAGILYIVMSLAEDGDLRSVVSESQALHRAIPEPVVLTWLRQTLDGLRHLHQQGVVHRDLKSSNIFLCNGRRTIRIGDFGISRVLDSMAHATSCVGTPAYMAPELMRNSAYAYPVDLWALGCICFELCALEVPFNAQSLVELACAVVSQDPDWTKLAGRSPELTEVCRRLLNKEVDERPTAAALLDEPFFAPGGRASLPPSEEDWAKLCHASDSKELQSPHKHGGHTATSMCTTRATDTGASSDQSVGTEDKQSHFSNDFAQRAAEQEAVLMAALGRARHEDPSRRPALETVM